MACRLSKAEQMARAVRVIGTWRLTVSITKFSSYPYLYISVLLIKEKVFLNQDHPFTAYLCVPSTTNSYLSNFRANLNNGQEN